MGESGISANRISTGVITGLDRLMIGRSSKDNNGSWDGFIDQSVFITAPSPNPGSWLFEKGEGHLRATITEVPVSLKAHHPLLLLFTGQGVHEAGATLSDGMILAR